MPAGLLIDSEPYRKALPTGDVTARNLFLAAMLYTPTNMALLSMLAELRNLVISQPQGDGS